MRSNNREIERRESDEITRLQAIIGNPCATSIERRIALEELEFYETMNMAADKRGWN